MRPHQVEAKIQTAPIKLEIGDLRFRNLLGAQQWKQLPTAIQKRFSKRLKAGDTAVYTGSIDRMAISKCGKFLTNFLRIIGAPLPLRSETGVAAIVTVTEDAETGGQIWSRLYASRHSFPQLIQSSKRFSGSTGLEEYIGYGIAMALRARCTNSAIIFESSGYFLQIGKWQMAIPNFLTPGCVIITHEEVSDKIFRFTLQLTHPVFGQLIEQSGLFCEQEI